MSAGADTATPPETYTAAYSAVPRFISECTPGVSISGAQKGAQAMGLALLPQGEQVARILDSTRQDGKPEYRTFVCQMSRRSAKTTSIQAVLLDRAFNTPGTKIVQTAQSQRIARRVFLDMVSALETAYPDEATRPFTARVGNGQEDLRWDNGSYWWVVAPKASAVRSAAADVVWIDEAGEFDDDQALDLMEGVKALGDTRPQAQVIISGTPAKTRSGLLWDYLQKGRVGTRRVGILDYSMEPTDDPTDEATWWRVHPGLASGLTDLETMQERYEDLPLVSWVREYMCADPVHANIAAIDPEDWLATQVPDLLEIPNSGLAIAFATDRDGAAGAISCAWYDDERRPHIQVLHYRPGTSWMPRVLGDHLKNLKGVPVVFDDIGGNKAIWQELQSQKGVPLSRLESTGVKQSAGGVSLLLSALSDRNLVHAKDPALDTAADGANIRYVNDSRLFGRRSSLNDVSPLESAALALYIASGLRKRERFKF